MLTLFLCFIEFYSLSIYPEIEEILKVSVKFIKYIVHSTSGADFSDLHV